MLYYIYIHTYDWNCTPKYRFGPLVIGIPSPSSGRVNNFEPLPSDRKMWRSFCIKYSTAVKTETFRSPWEASPCLQCSLLVLSNPFKKNEVRNCCGCASFRALVITCRQMSEAWVAPQSYWVLVLKHATIGGLSKRPRIAPMDLEINHLAMSPNPRTLGPLK